MKVKPICICGSIGKMAGTKDGPIFCMVCGTMYKNALELTKSMGLLNKKKKGKKK